MGTITDINHTIPTLTKFRQGCIVFAASFNFLTQIFHCTIEHTILYNVALNVIYACFTIPLHFCDVYTYSTNQTFFYYDKKLYVFYSYQDITVLYVIAHNHNCDPKIPKNIVVLIIS